jgi:hypothetical protein
VDDSKLAILVRQIRETQRISAWFVHLSSVIRGRRACCDVTFGGHKIGHTELLNTTEPSSEKQVIN